MHAKTGYMSLVKVRFNECDPMGHLNNANYLTYLEQIAFDASAAGGFDRFTLTEEHGALFVVRKHEITYHQPALENDLLLIRTWGQDVRAARAWREYTVSRYTGDPHEFNEGQVLMADMPEVNKRDIVASATTEFAFMNLSRGRPVRVPEAFIEEFFVGD